MKTLLLLLLVAQAGGQTAPHPEKKAAPPVIIACVHGICPEGSAPTLPVGTIGMWLDTDGYYKIMHSGKPAIKLDDLLDAYEHIIPEDKLGEWIEQHCRPEIALVVPSGRTCNSQTNKCEPLNKYIPPRIRCDKTEGN